MLSARWPSVCISDTIVVADIWCFIELDCGTPGGNHVFFSVQFFLRYVLCNEDTCECNVL